MSSYNTQAHTISHSTPPLPQSRTESTYLPAIRIKFLSARLCIYIELANSSATPKQKYEYTHESNFQKNQEGAASLGSSLG